MSQGRQAAGKKLLQAGFGADFGAGNVACLQHQPQQLLLTVDDTCVNHIVIEPAAAPAGKQQQQQNNVQSPQPPQRQFRGLPVVGCQPMDDDCRELLRRHFEGKINKTPTHLPAKAWKKKYELVAAFTIIGGEILSYSVYREWIPFQLTERRRRIIRTYYRTGERNLLLYVNSCEFEHYMPLDHLTDGCPHERRLRRRFIEAANETSGGQAGGSALRAMLGRGVLLAL